MFAAMAVAPALLRALGVDRMGVLSLIWVFVGYFSFLDLGLSRAVTVAVASLPHGPSRQEAERVIAGSALLALLALGGFVAMLLAVLVHAFPSLLPMPSPELGNEVRTAVTWILPSLPLLLASAALRGYFEGLSAFRALNLIRIPAGILLVLGPFVAAQYTNDLAWAAISILAVRCLQLLAMLMLLALHQSMSCPMLVKKMLAASQWQQLTRLLAFGGWMTVSSLLGPVIVYADRFVLGVIVGVGVVSLYAIPFDVVSRFPILIASAYTVLLPELVRLSSLVATGRRHTSEWQRLLRRAQGISGVLVGTGLLIGWLVIPDFMRWWMGPAFADESAGVAQLLLVAFAVNAMTQTPYTGLMALKQTRSIALIHLAEIVPYLACLWWAVSMFGMAGAAWACIGRGLVDYFLMSLACRHHARACS